LPFKGETIYKETYKKNNSMGNLNEYNRNVRPDSAISVKEK